MTAFTPSPEMIDAVSDWRLRRIENPAETPIVALLRDRFKISAIDAVAVIRAAKPGGSDAS